MIHLPIDGSDLNTYIQENSADIQCLLKLTDKRYVLSRAILLQPQLTTITKKHTLILTVFSDHDEKLRNTIVIKKHINNYYIW